MGIGLSVCSTIIKAHGGEITAENRPQGGACFRFWLEMEDMEHE
jgi:two-component system sensor histidine kinase KdpD